MIKMEAYASETHIPDIDLILPMLQEQMAFVGRKKNLEETRQALLNALRPGHRTVLFVAYNESDEPIAFAFGNAGFGLEVGEYFWINEMHVVEAHRGVGVASRFLLWIEKWLGERDIHYIASMAGTDNAASQNLFRKNGFEVEQVCWMEKWL